MKTSFFFLAGTVWLEDGCGFMLNMAGVIMAVENGYDFVEDIQLFRS
jgi:hypothetical protein